MTGPVPRTIAAMALIAALLASLYAAQPAMAQDAFAEDDLRRMADGLRNGTISIDSASDECLTALEKHPIREDLQEVMAGFLEVPEGIAGEAFCRALMRGIKSGDVSVDRVAQMIEGGRNPAPNPAGALEFGRLLRAVYFSHVVTTTASAEGRRPQ